MATNKHATIRYQALDKCFSNPGRKYFIEDLIDACNEALSDHYFKGDGIKRRQIFDDINFMESERGYSAPIEHHKDGKRVYYRYSDIKFSINSQPLNESEANQLKETLLLLSRFKGMPQFEWIDEMLVRLESAFKLKGQDLKAIEFEQNLDLNGLNFFAPLFNAIIYKKVLSIEYKGFKQRNAVNFTISPYFLKQYNNRWFLFGFNPQINAITNLAIDRIIKINEAKSKYKENTEFDFSEYFDDIIGVTLPENQPLQKVRIKVKKELWPYIETKPLHMSQKIKEKKDNYVIIELKLIVNFELIALLFSHADGLTILEPASLADVLKNKAKSLINNYL